jgi:WD40 repeat protein
LALAKWQELLLFSTISGKKLASAPSKIGIATQTTFSEKGHLIAVRGTDQTEIFKLGANSSIETVGSASTRNKTGFKARFIYEDNIFINYADNRLLLHAMDPGLPSIMSVYLGSEPRTVSDPITSGSLLRVATKEFIQSWDLAIDSLPYQAENPENTSPSLLTIDSNDRVLYLDGPRSTLYVKELGENLISFQHKVGLIKALAVNEATGQVALGTSDGEVLLLNTEDLSLIDSKFKFDNRIKSINSFDGDVLLVHQETYREGVHYSTLTKLNIGSGEKLNFDVAASIYFLNYERSLNRLAAMISGKLIVIDSETMNEVFALEDKEELYGFSFTGFPKKLVSISQKYIKTWDPITYSLLSEVPLIESNYFLPAIVGFIESKQAYIELPNDRLSMRLKSLKTGEFLTPIMELTDSETEKILTVAVSKDQQLIAAMGSKGEIMIWSTQDGSKVRLPYRIGAYDPNGWLLPISLQFANNDTVLIANTLDGLFSRSLLAAAGSYSILDTLSGVLSNQKIDNTGSLVPLTRIEYEKRLREFVDNAGDLITKPKFQSSEVAK